MARKFVRLPVNGIDNSNIPEEIDAQYGVDALNVRFKYGEVVNRPGTAFISDVTEQPLWFGRFFSDFSGTNTNFSIMITNSFMYRLSGTTWVKIDTFDSNPLPGTGRYGVAIGEGKIFVSRKGMGYIAAWNGNTAAAMTRLTDSSGNAGFPGNVVPGARYLEYFNVRLIAGYMQAGGWLGGAEQSTRIQWSQNADSGNWNPVSPGTGGFLDLTSSALGDEQAEPLTGIKALAGRMAAYKRHSIVDVVPTGLLPPDGPIFSTEVRIRGLGCASPFSLASVGQVHFFLGEDNIYSWDGIQIRPVGTRIQKVLVSIIDVTQMAAYFGVASVDSQEYYLCLNNNITYVYDYLRDQWFRDRYPTDGTKTISAMGSADANATVYNWAGAPSPIPGTWMDHPEAWFDLNVAGFAALFVAASPVTAGYGTGYQTAAAITDYDASSPLQLVQTKNFYNDDPYKLANVKRVMLKYGDADGTFTELIVNALTDDTTITETMNTSSMLPGGGYIWFEFNVSGNPINFALRSQGALVKWQSLIVDWEQSGDQMPSF